MATTDQIYRLAKRAVLLDVTHLLRVNNPIDIAAGEFEFRELTPGCVIQNSQDATIDLDASLASRLDLGHDHCFGAFDRGRLVGYCWFAIGSIEAEHNQGDHPKTGVPLSFPCDTAFLYKAFTRRTHRGQRLFSRVVSFAFRQLQTRGIRNLISTTDWTNQPAVRAFEKCGFRSIGLIWRVGRFSTGVTRGPAAASEFAIRIGRDAIVQARP